MVFPIRTDLDRSTGTSVPDPQMIMATTTDTSMSMQMVTDMADMGNMAIADRSRRRLIVAHAKNFGRTVRELIPGWVMEYGEAEEVVVVAVAEEEVEGTV